MFQKSRVENERWAEHEIETIIERIKRKEAYAGKLEEERERDILLNLTTYLNYKSNHQMTQSLRNWNIALVLFTGVLATATVVNVLLFYFLH